MEPFDTQVLRAIFGGALGAFIVLWFISAPYGRHVAPGWGPTVPSKGSWMLMEAVGFIVMPAVTLAGPHGTDPGALVLLALWTAHYVHRALILPLQQRAPSRPVPLLVPSLAIVFNSLNGFANGRSLGWHGGYDLTWFAQPQVWLGLALFLAGEAINLHADYTLLSLRKPGETGYKIPTGGAYRWVSSANYLGEIIAWGGWAIATGSTAGVAFFVFTAANLVPRARDNHAWYRATFPDYPPERRALIPWIW